jgi:hypothetical protein
VADPWLGERFGGPRAGLRSLWGESIVVVDAGIGASRGSGQRHGAALRLCSPSSLPTCVADAVGRLGGRSPLGRLDARVRLCPCGGGEVVTGNGL